MALLFISAAYIPSLYTTIEAIDPPKPLQTTVDDQHYISNLFMAHFLAANSDKQGSRMMAQEAEQRRQFV